MINKLESEILNQIVIAISVIKIQIRFNRFPSALSSVASVQGSIPIFLISTLMSEFTSVDV